MNRTLLNEIPMVGVGTGLALAGASISVIGAQVIKKDVYSSAILITGGVWFARFGYLVAAGAIRKVRELR